MIRSIISSDPSSEKRKYAEVTISNPSEKYFFVKTENRLQKVFFDDILWVEGQGDYLRIISSKREDYDPSKFQNPVINTA